MPRKRRKRPNWPYRFAWIVMLLALTGYVAARTILAALTFGNRAYGIDWGLAFVASCFDASIAIWFVVVGACIGSFLNVVAYRLPRGRYIGGHSSCPYCQTPIEAHDNIPVLAWIKLRGRCRTCRLPISIQYPLVELSVAIVFLMVYLTEFASGGANLPGARPERSGGGILRIAVTPEAIMQLVAYLFALSSLIGAALIAVRHRQVPLKLYAWAILPQLLLALVFPEVLCVSWRGADVELIKLAGPIEMRLDVIITMVCGAAAVIAVARLIAPIAYSGFDRSLLASDTQSVGARQFVGAMAVAGSLLGWQSVVPLAWSVVLCAIFSVFLIRLFLRNSVRKQPIMESIGLGDLTVWVWLGLLVMRANWSSLLSLQVIPTIVPEVLRHVLGAVLLAPVVLAFSQISRLGASPGFFRGSPGAGRPCL